MDDYSARLRRLADTLGPIPQYPWPDPSNAEIARLKAENEDLRRQLAEAHEARP